MKIGQPVVVVNVVCRISRIEGGVIFARTPHGTLVKSGLAWVVDPTERDLRYLRELEHDAASRPRRLSEVYK